MKEDIKYLDKMVKEYKQFGDLHNPDYEDTDRIYQAIENLIKGYRILEFENQALQNTKDTCPNMATSGIRCDIKSNYIPKSKIKEKIEQLKSNLSDAPFNRMLNFTIESKIQVLQELMEDK